MWWISFVLHEMASGLLSVFIPLYMLALGCSLTYMGFMFSTAILSSIPASLLWGYLCDKNRRYKQYILLSFLSLTLLLYVFTLTTNIALLMALYSIMAFLHMAHEPPKNVLIAESYTRRYWERAYGIYEGITGIGRLLGMLVGFCLSTRGLAASHTLLACSILNFAAFILSIFLIEDPVLVFERSLVKIEKGVYGAYRGLTIAFGVINSANYVSTEAKNSTKELCLGLTMFFMATKILFTPLPIFLLKNFSFQQNIVYALFCVNSAGSIAGYFLTSKLSPFLNREILFRSAAMRCILTFSLIAVGFAQEHGMILTAATLFLLGLVYATFHTLSLSISMEILPEGMAGIFNVVSGLGEALGSFAGPFIAEKYGFTYLFLGAGLTYFATCIILRKFATS